MLRDITIGQHFPGTSPVHRCGPALKIIADHRLYHGAVYGFQPAGALRFRWRCCFLYKVARFRWKLIAKSLKPIVPIMLFTAILNLCFITGEGQPLVHFGLLTIYREGVSYAVLIVVRIVCIIAGTSLLTYTTSPIVLTDAIERTAATAGKAAPAGAPACHDDDHCPAVYSAAD